MKLSAAQGERFLKEPDPAVVAVLLYGPDGGLVAERGESLLRRVAEDPHDPFRVSELTAERLCDDPALLADEAGALSLTGGRRVVRLRGAVDGSASAVDAFLAAAGGDTLLVALAGDLPARSRLRKLFEAHKQAAALPCYKDDARALATLVRESLGAAGLSVEPEALAYLTSRLGGDRQITRQELEKLRLFKGAEGGSVTLADVEACVGDSAELTLEDLAFAVAGGELAAAERSLSRALAEGSTPVGVLRAVSRHLRRLHQVAGRCAGGASMDSAVKALRPPVFWKVAEAFQRQAAAWPGDRLAWALESLLTCEAGCKTTGAPAELLVRRRLLEIAVRSPMRQRARDRR